MLLVSCFFAVTPIDKLRAPLGVKAKHLEIFLPSNIINIAKYTVVLILVKILYNTYNITSLKFTG